MFDYNAERYMTRAIAEEVPLRIALHLWSLINEQIVKGVELDYIQVFELSANNKKQAIIHRQEIPKRESFWIIPLEDVEPIDRTIWCIDNGENQMMLFPEDY